MAKVFCSNCPCMNNDNEYGVECNLGFDCRMESDYIADNCGLEFIRFAGGEFRPTLRAVDPPSALVSAAGSENSAGN